MKSLSKKISMQAVREFAAIVCMGVLLPGSAAAVAAPQTQLPDAPSAQSAAKIPADQLDSLVAPIALYPDPLLSQVLVASTYPLEVIQLQQWLAQHKGLNEKGAGRCSRRSRIGTQVSRAWLACPMRSSCWPRTSSGQPTLGTHFSRSRAM